MATFIRGIQTGVKRDLSAGLSPTDISLVEHSRFGVNSKIIDIAYDPVQSLLAVGTLHSPTSPGRVYIFGRGRTEESFGASSNTANITSVRFCRDTVVASDSAGVLTVFSLGLTRIIATQLIHGGLTTLTTDPSLDFVFIGTQIGTVCVFDLATLKPAPFDIKGLGAQLKNRVVSSPVRMIVIHPRDIATFMVVYDEGIVIFSFATNASTGLLEYDPLPPNKRRPRLTTATWHPTGTFIACGYDNGDIVFWDPKTMKMVEAQKPVGSIAAVKQIVWCAKIDPDDTGLLISGGGPGLGSSQGLLFSDLGRTPVYNTSSWKTLASHLLNPVSQQNIPTPPNVELVKFITIPRVSPFYAGSQDPIAIMGLLSSGGIITMSFPRGYAIPVANQIPISLSFVHPFVQQIGMSRVDAQIWDRMVENRNSGPKLLKGGLEAKADPSKIGRVSNIIHTFHADGFVRLWDASSYATVNNRSVVQVDVGLAVGRLDNIRVTAASFSGLSREVTVGLHSGELLIFKWDLGDSKRATKLVPGIKNSQREFVDISTRFDRDLGQGMIPFVLLDSVHGPVTTIQHTDIGFVAAGYEDGSLVVICTNVPNGPKVIFDSNILDTSLTSKKRTTGRFGGSGRGGSSSHPDDALGSVSTLVFSVMTCDGDNYSSILLHVGTKAGLVSTFKILPHSGTYQVLFAGSVACEAGPIVHISAINLSTGNLAVASTGVVSALGRSEKVDGILVAVSRSGVRVFKPATLKGAHKSWSGNVACVSAEIVFHRILAPGADSHLSLIPVTALMTVSDDGNARVFSLPALKEVVSVSMGGLLDKSLLAGTIVTPTGEIYGWTGLSELVGFDIFGKERSYFKPLHRLFYESSAVPERPVISNMQWISGAQYITPENMILLIAGKPQTETTQSNLQSISKAPAVAGPGYMASLQDAFAQRGEATKRLDDTMNELGNQANEFSNGISKMVKDTKKNMVLGMFGL